MSEVKDITKPVDDDLDELLDSKSNIRFYYSFINYIIFLLVMFFVGALDDFDKVKNDTPASSTETEDPPMESLWNDEFIASQSKVFEAKMAELFGAAGTGGNMRTNINVFRFFLKCFNCR